MIESFLFGIMAAVVALTMEILSTFSFFGNGATPEEMSIVLASPTFLLLSSIIEESAKFLFVVGIIKTFSKSERELVTSSLFAGVGFAATELILNSYLGSFNISENYFEIALIAILHITTFGLIGGIVPLFKTFFSGFLVSVSIASVLHFMFNYQSAQETISVLLTLRQVAIISLLIFLNICAFFISRKNKLLH